MKRFPKMERNNICTFLLLLTLWAAIGASGLTIQGRGNRIMGGKEVEPHSLPWQAMVRDPSGLFICGGTILSSRFIMSAAQCLIPTNPNPNLPTANTIEVGIHSESQGEPSQSSHRIKNVDFHPGFEIIKWSLSNSVNSSNAINSSNAVDDFAIVELREPIKFRDEVKAIFLPSAADNEEQGTFNKETVFVASGWRRIDDGEF